MHGTDHKRHGDSSPQKHLFTFLAACPSHLARNAPAKFVQCGSAPQIPGATVVGTLTPDKFAFVSQHFWTSQPRRHGPALTVKATSLHSAAIARPRVGGST
ncbi:hypothetical protein PAPYR_11915 [Paratrimastix pyriformis]|uniref:Uncharacterized protein n=1 Tax=Paratrimastix pyriformis TaxID=342808 RepID=A0ABQ8U594_9EUKA|nr:hypothetical protein PAPYR_11915 [Paratrimastix pyriformis]